MKGKTLLIGFSTGCFYKTKIKPISLDCFKIIKSTEASAIEINCIDINNLYRFSKITKTYLLKNFSYISLHAPAKNFYYRDNLKSRSILELIFKLNKEIELNCVIIHPDKVLNWKLFKNYPLNFAVENMDARKKTGKTAKSLTPILKKTNFKMTLDLNHCFTNDTSMRLAKNFIKKYENKIAQAHVSGYIESHQPLYLTKQTQILKPIKCLTNNFPIIVESVFSKPKEIYKEYKFVKSQLVL